MRGRPRNRWQDEVREYGRIVGGEGWQEKVHKRGMEEAPEKGKESSHSAHANGMNIYIYIYIYFFFFLSFFLFSLDLRFVTVIRNATAFPQK